ncbi:hypothetical protein P4123_10150 [Pseudomonas aeruginosa]|nr:hypothetical protein [Pseudomonas aeruginosa]
MSASFSAPRLRPGSSRPATWWRRACSTRPTATCASSVRASWVMDLRQWIAAAGAGLRDSLLRHGGILFH